MKYAKCSIKDEALSKIRAGTRFDEVPIAGEGKDRLKPQDKIHLGWKTKSDLKVDFWKSAYECEVSSYSSPQVREAKTDWGYHIIMVHGRK